MSIQPHGALLVLDEGTLRITQASTTCETLVGVAVADLLERDVASALDPMLAEAVRVALGQYTEFPAAPASLVWSSGLSGLAFDVDVHRSEGLVVVELTPEAAGAGPPSAGASELRLTRMMRAMRAREDVRGKAQAAVESLRGLTGYDRVMVYRFHDDGHGEVIAEACRDDLVRHLGLHYPASDIPAQARAMLLVCPVREIADVAAVPSPLLPAVNPVTGRPLDVSRSVLRSASPVHLAYMRNMAAASSLTASLVVDDELWGLLACHHVRPHRIPHEAREVAGFLALDLAGQISVAETRAQRRYAARLKQCRDATLVAMRGGSRLAALLRGPELADLLGAVGADGVAIVHDKEIVTGGVTPDPERILDMTTRLGLLHADKPTALFSTECLSEHLPTTADLAASAAGVVMFSVSTRAFTLVWFRGEHVRSVSWGGDPDKAFDVTAEGRISPRKSFESWTQRVGARSPAWRADELESAEELRATIEIEWRRAVEDSLSQTELLLDDVLDAQTAHIAVLNGDGVITKVNRAWRRFDDEASGVVRGDVGGDYLALSRTKMDDRASATARAALDGIRDVLGGARDHYRKEYRWDLRVPTRWFDVGVHRLGGAKPGVVIVHEEITARRADQAALARERERYRTLMTIARDGIHLLDMEGRLIEANDAFLASIGRRREEIGRLGVRDWDSALPDADVPAGLRQMARQAGVFEARHLRPDGRIVDVEVSAGGVELDGATFILASSRDISARKELERQLLANQAQLEALNRSLQERVDRTVAELRSKDQILIRQGRQAAMGEMIGNIAHQWRQPLNALSLVLANLRDASRFGELDASTVEEAVGTSNRLIQRMSSTINDFRDFLVPEKKKSVFSGRAEIDKTLQLIDASYRDAGIEVVVEETADVSLLGFSNEYSQVLLNLLSNAKQAIESSGVEHGRITLRLEARDGLACLVVRDNGGGIPEGILDKIFEPYFSTKPAGSGIGLYMSRQIIEQSLGGRLEARNVEGGAELTISTPVAGDS